MLSSIAEFVARLVLGRPRLSLAVLLVFGGVAASVASTIDFDTRFSALLSDDAPELEEVNELRERAGGTVELIIAVAAKGDAEGASTGPDGRAKITDAARQRRLAFARDVVGRLQPKPWIRRADVEWPVDFFKKRRLLLASVDTLKKLKAAIRREIQRAKARANPLYVDLEDDAQKEKPWEEVDKTSAIDASSGLLKRTFTSKDDRYLFIRVKPRGSSFEMAAGKKLLHQIKKEVRALDPARRGISVRYAGGLVLNQEQHERMSSDLRRTAIIATVLILLLMTLHIRRALAPVVLFIPLAIGVSTTLAITALTIGRLNLVSGFLVSALIGLGIDFEIHLYLRYLEYRSSCDDKIEAMSAAIAATLPACVTAATTTAAAFFAMAVSDFNGYREYGLIAGMGVLITLVIAYLTLPPVAVLIGGKGKPVRAARQPGRGFRPQLAASMVAVGLGALALSLYSAPRVRWHSDFNELRGVSEQVEFNAYVEDTLGGSLSPAAILVRSIPEARRVERYLDKRIADPHGQVKRYISMASMVPRRAARKMKLIHDIRGLLDEVAKVKLKRADRKRVDEAIELTEVHPWSIPEIPEVFRRQFQTVDRKAHFVVVWPRSKMFLDRDVIAWGRELNRVHRELRQQGIPVKILDENRVAGRALSEMRADSPAVVAAAAIAVLLILILDFRSLWPVVLVAGSLGVGIAWMLGVMVVTGVDLNVFNLAVLPTVIGLGIDNAVHVQHRYAQEGPGSLAYVVSTTGSASFLASATTAIGFGAAITAHHLGVRSLGSLALIGFSCTFVSSTVFFPAVLRVLELSSRRSRARDAAWPPTKRTAAPGAGPRAGDGDESEA